MVELHAHELMRCEMYVVDSRIWDSLYTFSGMNRKLFKVGKYMYLSVEHSELDRNYAPSVCDWLYST